jgi:hypothetical protein
VGTTNVGTLGPTDVGQKAAVLGRGGQVGPHRGEVLSTGKGTQAPGHLLLDLDHAEVALGRVVVERDLQVGGKPQVRRVNSACSSALITSGVVVDVLTRQPRMRRE